jgi:hypothetical protein
MEVRRHANAADFLERARTWLLRAEAANNLTIGIALNAAADEPGEQPRFWATVEDHGEVLGCCFRTPPHHVGLTSLPSAAIPLLIERLHLAYDAVPGVSGPPQPAKAFAEGWCETAGASWTVHSHQRIHELRAVQRAARSPPGALRSATSTDIPLAKRWMAEFIRDAGVLHVSEDLAVQLVRRGQLFIWDDRGARSMVATSRETPNGACISAVYTPRERRRRGYASAAVTELSSRLLGAGKQFCCLYTDLANPTSNSIYRRIGYVPVEDAMAIEFE